MDIDKLVHRNFQTITFGSPIQFPEWFAATRFYYTMIKIHKIAKWEIIYPIFRYPSTLCELAYYRSVLEMNGEHEVLFSPSQDFSNIYDKAPHFRSINIESLYPNIKLWSYPVPRLFFHHFEKLIDEYYKVNITTPPVFPNGYGIVEDPAGHNETYLIYRDENHKMPFPASRKSLLNFTGYDQIKECAAYHEHQLLFLFAGTNEDTEERLQMLKPDTERRIFT